MQATSLQYQFHLPLIGRMCASALCVSGKAISILLTQALSGASIFEWEWTRPN
jgi:hypothetical protein